MNNYYSHSSLKEAENTLHNILDIISDGVWDWNALTGKVERNSSWYKMLGYKTDTFDKNIYSWENIIHPEDYPMVIKHFEAYLNKEINTYKIKYRCKKSDGSYLWILDSGRTIEYTKDGKVSRMIGAHKNIHEEEISNKKLKEQNDLLHNDNITLEQIIEKRTQELNQLNTELENKIKEIEYSAAYDIVTNIFNRRKFEEVLKKEINRAQRYFHSLSIILLDIDKFKKFNDIYGHKIGDKVLLSLATILKNNIREVDIVARWGGEEFIIILPNTSKSNAVKKAECLRSIIENTNIIENEKITCSFGVSTYIEGDDETSIFLRIDKALYLAKHDNRNNVKVL
jgi:diguanylate cyclase (GGDEF)-like protein/PAS domain S-box-containing protein